MKDTTAHLLPAEEPAPTASRGLVGLPSKWSGRVWFVLVVLLFFVSSTLPEPWRFAVPLSIVLAAMFRSTPRPAETVYTRRKRILSDLRWLAVLFTGLLAGRHSDLQRLAGFDVDSINFLIGAAVGTLVGLVVTAPIFAAVGATLLGNEGTERRARFVRVTGKVQGVFYRAWTKQMAQSLGVYGWVQNREDGSVQAQLEGPLQAVQTLIHHMHSGPPAARVDSVQVVETSPTDISAFEIRH